jgi:siroheme synthase-like protein
MTNDSSETLRFLPVGLRVRGMQCAVVGGGQVGTRKIRTLLDAGALVTVIAPSVTSELAEQIGLDRVAWVRDSFRPEHLEGSFLVIAATNDRMLNATIVSCAAKSGALVCDASSAERSQVILGALHRGEDVTIAVFSDGRDPARARRTRDRIATLLDSEEGSSTGSEAL